MVMYHFIVHNHVGVILKRRGPMLEFGHDKNAQLLMDNELHILKLYTKLNTTILEIKYALITTCLNVMVHRSL